MSDFLKVSAPATHEFWEIPILYEDPHLLALDKPSGLLTSPDRFNPERPDLMGLLHAAIKRGVPWARSRGVKYLANTHRLEFDVSGALMLAKDKATLTDVVNQFSAGSPFLSCVALVRGSFVAAAFGVEAKLAPHPLRPGLYRVDPRQGRKAHTQFTVIERFAGYALLRCQPWPARPQQVQAHLRHVGLPLVGDPRFGGQPLFLSTLKRNYRPKPGEPERPLIGRSALHAETLSFLPPDQPAPVTITAPWPKDLTVGLKYLRRFAQDSFLGRDAFHPRP